MNQRNVDALYEALNGMLHSVPQEKGEDHYAWLRKCAVWLGGKRGALIPSALTDEDCRAIAAVGQAFITSNTLLANFDSAVAAKLERIAKGEEAHSEV